MLQQFATLRADVLSKLDRVQSKFLEDAGIDEVSALMQFNLAPLAVWRDIVMLGLIHRTAVGKGPSHFKEHFKLEAHGRIKDRRANLKATVVRRSGLGLVAVYNLLPQSWKNIKTVKGFQKHLQEKLKTCAKEGCEQWQQL